MEFREMVRFRFTNFTQEFPAKLGDYLQEHRITYFWANEDRETLYCHPKHAPTVRAWLREHGVEDATS